MTSNSIVSSQYSFGFRKGRIPNPLKPKPPSTRMTNCIMESACQTVVSEVERDSDPRVAIPPLLVEHINILLMEEILHQLIGSLSHCLHGFIHPMWCRISSINSTNQPIFFFGGGVGCWFL